MEIDLSIYREKYNTDAGHAFEYWCKDKLEELGYTNVEVTQGSGDFGVAICDDSVTKYLTDANCYKPEELKLDDKVRICIYKNMVLLDDFM